MMGFWANGMRKLIPGVIIATFAVLAVLWIIGLGFPTHLYSPGDLCKDHQGIKNCKQCHAPFKGAVSRLCMADDCHTAGRLSQLSNKPLSELHTAFAEKDCLDCHTEHQGFAGKTTKPFDHKILAFNILNECAACHTDDYQKAHPARYTLDCKSCHSTKKWKPATFDHDKHFPLTGDHAVSCNTCHPNGNYQQYTCLNCHEHNTAHIRHEHEEHGIHDYGDCLRCHRMKIDGKYYGNPREEYDEGEDNDDDDDDDD